MLRIIVELVPFGNEDEKRKIGSMTIANVGWNRANSVWELISMAVRSADDHEEETDTMKRLALRL